jgi:hypothetical protein
MADGRQKRMGCSEAVLGRVKIGLKGNGYKEMLRGSREEALIVPVTGKELRAAVRDGDFLKLLVECWEAAVHL